MVNDTSVKARPMSADEALLARRKKWAAETAKRIHVVVRARPMSMREIKEYSKDIVYMNEDVNECTVVVPKPSKAYQQSGGNPNKSITFSFDRYFNPFRDTINLA